MSLTDRAVYRARQLRRSLWPRITQSEIDEARRVLGPQLYPLFASMQPADQRHCLDVLEHLEDSGCTDTEVLQAALIHDAGKGHIAGARFGVHHRVAYVALEHIPGALGTLARYNRGLRSLRDHDRLTLELATEYGAPEGVIALLKAMESGQAEDRAAALVAADNAS
jgi:hypothetical protein